jgi:hypothetical protein
MKKNLIITSTSLILAALGLLGTSCSDMKRTGSHEMGPPGKTRLTSDADMPGMAR